MSYPKAVVATDTVDRAVFVEACEPGWDPQTVVRHVVWHDGQVHEELQVFPTLRDALAYAQKACSSPDGPLVARANRIR